MASAGEDNHGSGGSGGAGQQQQHTIRIPLPRNLPPGQRYMLRFNIPGNVSDTTSSFHLSCALWAISSLRHGLGYRWPGPRSWSRGQGHQPETPRPGSRCSSSSSPPGSGWSELHPTTAAVTAAREDAERGAAQGNQGARKYVGMALEIIQLRQGRGKNCHRQHIGFQFYSDQWELYPYSEERPKGREYSRPSWETIWMVHCE